MKKLLLGALIVLLPLTAFSATILGFQVGGGTWAHDPSGSISTSSDGVGVSADLKSDLKLSEEKEGYFYFLLEHPIPVIPNFKYVNTKLTSSGTGTVTVDFIFNGEPYDVTDNITTQLELNQEDIILYYEILDNVISLDIGLNIKTVSGKVAVNNDSTSFSGDIPMLYVAAEVVLPGGFTIAAEISTISASGNEFTDTTAKLTYTTPIGLGIEIGIRDQNIVIDVDNVDANIKFSGLFAGVYFKF